MIKILDFSLSCGSGGNGNDENNDGGCGSGGDGGGGSIYDNIKFIVMKLAHSMHLIYDDCNWFL